MLRVARILIVDDEADNRTLLELILAREGFCTVSAVSGEDALQRVAVALPDLILLDLMMPGMDGFAVTAHLKRDARTCEVPIVVLSAADDSVTRARALLAGAEAFLTKPILRLVLCERVRSILYGPALRWGHNGRR